MGDSESASSSGGFNDPQFETSEPETKGGTEDGMLAAIILGAAVALVILGALLFRKKSSNSGDSGDLTWLAESSDLSSEQFEAPKERQEYIEARSKLDVKKPEDLLKLKKMLMIRSENNPAFVRVAEWGTFS